MLQNLNVIPLWIVTLLFAGILFAAVHAGSRLRRFVGTDPATVASGQLIFGTMTILSLIIGFTFSLALNRHDLRRDLVLEESNTIRAMHRALTYVAEPDRQRIATSLTAYAKGRLAFVQSNLLQQQVLAPHLLAQRENLNRAVASIAPTSVTGADRSQLLGYASRTLDAGSRMDTISYDHVPARVILMLVLLSIGSALMLGISIGDKWRTLRLPIAMWSVLLSLALFTIVDLDAPQWGGIRIDSRPLENAITILAPAK